MLDRTLMWKVMSCQAEMYSLMVVCIPAVIRKMALNLKVEEMAASIQQGFTKIQCKTLVRQSYALVSDQGVSRGASVIEHRKHSVTLHRVCG